MTPFNIRITKELLLVLVFTLILLTAPAIAFSSDSSVSTASLFSIGTGARPLGMGNAFVGLADDENALFYNPAGLAFIDKAGVTSFYTNQYSQLQYGSVGYAQPNLGLGYLHLSSGELTKTDLYGNSTGTFSYTSRGLIGTYTNRIDDLALGLQGKAFIQTNPGTGYGYSFSPSFLYELKPFRVGGIFKNLISTGIKYTDDYTESWDKELTFGVAYMGDNFNLNLGFDAMLTERGINPGVARAGAEMTMFPPVTARLGITSKLKSSAGFSIEFDRFQLDYAYSLHKELAKTHRISLTARFEKLVDLKGIMPASIMDKL